MTYLFKATTQENRFDDMIALATGQIADDNGVTLGAEDAWQIVGDANTSYGMTYLKAPDDTYNMVQQHRSGFWLRIDDTFNLIKLPARSGSYVANNSPEVENYDADGNRLRGETYCRQTQCWTAMNSDDYWWAAVHVYEPNTVAFDYSDAKIQISLFYQSDRRQYTNTNVFYAIDADGFIDYTYSSYNMKMQLSDPSGFLDQGARFVRLFDQNFLGGFDVHRFTENNVGARSFNVVCDGVEGTDWAFTGGFGGYSADDDARPGYDERYDFSAMYPGSTDNPWSYGKFSGGIGIKTDAALTGNLYEVVIPVEDSLIGFKNHTQWLYYTYSIPTEKKAFTGVSNYWNGGTSYLGGNDTRLMTCRNSTSNPPGETPVNLYMNVTKDYLQVICLLTGTAYGSQPGVLNHCRIISTIPTNPRSVWSTNNCYTVSDTVYPYPHTVTGPVPIWMQVFDEGRAKGLRDWQTGWGMYDYHQPQVYYAGQWRWETAWRSTYEYSVHAMHYFREEDNSYIPGIESDVDYATKSGTKGLGNGELPIVRLDLMSYYAPVSNDTSANAIYTQNYGTQMGALFPVIKSSLANGDELEDTTTGKKWKVFRTTTSNSVPRSSVYAMMIEMN
jgi:hypothetical protein